MKQTCLSMLIMLMVGTMFAQSPTIIEKEIEKEVSITEDDGIKKIVIIERDSDGNEKVIEWEGDSDEEMPAEVKEALEHVNVEVVREDEPRKKRVMKFIDEEGNEEVIEWNGEGEMPEKMRREMKKRAVQGHRPMEMREMREERRVMKWVDEDGNEEVIEWDGQGEMPEEMKNAMKKHGMHGHKMEMKKEWKEKWENASDEEKAKMKEQAKELMIEKRIERRDGMGGSPGMNRREDNKPRMGVEIEETKAGVVVNRVMPGSAAERAGLQEGDVIYKVDDTNVNSIDKLMGELSTQDKNNTIKVKYIRSGKKKSTKITLQ